MSKNPAKTKRDELIDQVLGRSPLSAQLKADPDDLPGAEASEGEEQKSKQDTWDNIPV